MTKLAEREGQAAPGSSAAAAGPGDAERALERAIARLQARVLAVSGAVLGGGSVFLATAWLLVKGGPQVGPHLQLLGQYFLGYSVSWPGSLIGGAYGALLGGLIGWSIGTIYNQVVELRR